jgi:hypothetical protein
VRRKEWLAKLNLSLLHSFKLTYFEFVEDCQFGPTEQMCRQNSDPTIAPYQNIIKSDVLNIFSFLFMVLQIFEHGKKQMPKLAIFRMFLPFSGSGKSLLKGFLVGLESQFKISSCLA